MKITFMDLKSDAEKYEVEVTNIYSKLLYIRNISKITSLEKVFKQQ